MSKKNSFSDHKYIIFETNFEKDGFLLKIEEAYYVKYHCHVQTTSHLIRWFIQDKSKKMAKNRIEFININFIDKTQILSKNSTLPNFISKDYANLTTRKLMYFYFRFTFLAVTNTPLQRSSTNVIIYGSPI